jgi:hypothetical protein
LDWSPFCDGKKSLQWSCHLAGSSVESEGKRTMNVVPGLECRLEYAWPTVLPDFTKGSSIIYRAIAISSTEEDQFMPLDSETFSACRET